MNVDILRTGAILPVVITCTVVAFEYMEEYYSCFVGSVFLMENWMMVGILIGVLDFTVIEKIIQRSYRDFRAYSVSG